MERYAERLNQIGGAIPSNAIPSNQVAIGNRAIKRLVAEVRSSSALTDDDLVRLAAIFETDGGEIGRLVMRVVNELQRRRAAQARP